MQTRPILTVVLALTATPVGAGPFVPAFAVPATQTGQQAEAPVRHGFAIAAFDGTSVPMRTVDGALDQRAYRLDGVRDNTLALLLPLQDQLAQAGFKPVFDCDTTGCGGFDFRFGIDVLAEPQMHVDLGDFRYLVAENAGGDMVSLLVSKAADQGFVQVTSVTRGRSPVQTTEPAVEVAVAPAAPALPEPTPPDPQTAPQPEPSAPPGSLGERLLTIGSVALDDLVFASGKATLEDQDYASLTGLADWLKANPDLTVTLVGHTDATGSLQGNIALSRLRAAAVRARLMTAHDVAGDQVDAQGAGYLAPRATNQTPDGRQKNRRVEVMLTSTPVK